MDKASIKFLWLFAISGLISNCSKSQKIMTDERILIVYLSRTNNTKAVANMIHKYVGGEIVAIEPKNPYPQDYKAIVEQVDKENEVGFLPPLKTTFDTIQEYDVVFIGFPTWDMQLPPPVKTFLKQ